MIGKKDWGALSFIHVFSVAYSHDKHNQLLVPYLAEEAVIPNAIFPKLTESWAFESLAEATRIFQFGDTLR